MNPALPVSSPSRYRLSYELRQYCYNVRSHDSEITTSWMTEGPEFESRWVQEFSLLHIARTGSGAHPASYPTGTDALSPVVERPGREAYHLSPTGAEVKKILMYTSPPPYVFMALGLIS
jgi:hypothetical protein